MPTPIPAFRGAYRKVKLTLPAGTYTGSETVSAVVWPGDDQPASFAPSVAWLDADERTLTLEWDGDDTEDLAPGRYPILLSIASGGNVSKLEVGILDLRAVPGTGDAPTAYCTADEVRRVAPWLDQLQAESDQAGFAEARALARDEFDRLIQVRYAGAGLVREDSFDHLLDGGWESGGDDATLQGWLDDDRLVLTGPTGKAIRRWNAYTAAALACESQVGLDDTYAKRARACRARADELLCGMTVGIDTTEVADGVADVEVPLGRIRTIRR